MKIACIVTENGFSPLYPSDLDEKQKLKKGSVIMVEYTRPRNIDFHKKFFALMKLTLDNMPEHLQKKYALYSQEQLINYLKKEFGLYRIVNVEGKDMIEYHSLSFSAMDQDTFERFYHCCVLLIQHRFLNIEENQFEEALIDYL